MHRNVRSTAASGSSVYESERASHLLLFYLQFHFATAEDMFPYEPGPTSALDFSARCAALCAEATGAAAGSGQRALDVGCAVGGASFELSRRYDDVIGLDFSERFVGVAAAMAARGALPYRSLVEGERTVARTARLPLGARIESVRFRQGDACDLPTSELGPFDAVLASNLLCRLPRPRAFLGTLAALVRSGGVAVVVSPYSWLEEYTPKELWLGGLADAGCNDDEMAEITDTAETADSGSQGGANDGIGAMEPSFALEKRQPMPFIIREHARKFQWGVSDGTVWRRR
ncbi:unnamed protein product [Phaeothamnion confervicola]